MNQINFTSRIHPVTLAEFGRITSSIPSKNEVKYPWTIKDSKIASDVYTKRICDCTAAIISTGKEALMLHLNPEISNNHAFLQVLTFLRSNIDLTNKNLQAVIIGSKNTKKSQDIYNKFIDMLAKLHIPTTEIKNGKNPTNVAYKSSNDEIIITNASIDKLLKKGQTATDSLHASFEKISISNKDEFYTQNHFDSL